MSAIDDIDVIEDAEILSNVISVCRDGEILYRYIAAQVEDQQSRNMFSDMAVVRSKIVEELEFEVADRGVELKKPGKVASRISEWYEEARSRFADYHDEGFIEQLKETEERSLEVLRSAVKDVEDKKLTIQLSSLVATFQIAHDRMRSM